MKKILLTTLCAVLCCGLLPAQDINEAIELYNSGLKAYQDKDYAGAIAGIEKAHTIAAAIADADEAATVRTNCEAVIPTLYLAQGRDYAANRQTTEAEATLQKAIDLAALYNNDAVREEALALYPALYTAAGASNFNEKQYAEAIANFKKVLEYDPDNSTAQLRIGQAYLQLKDNGTAEKELVAAKTLADKVGNAKDADAAAKQLGRLYFTSAVAMQQAKQWKDAVRNATQAVEYDPANTQAQKLLGIAAVETKDWTTAVAALEIALAADPAAKDKTTTIYRLATACEGAGNKAKACDYYKQLTADANYKAVAEHKIKTELKCN